MKILIKNGHLIDNASNRDGLFNVVIEDEIVSRITECVSASMLDESEYDEVIDANGLYVMPGFIDLHVHLREPGFEYKETIKTGAMAASKGGFTSICAMPNTKPVIDCPEMIKYIVDKAKKDAVVNVLPVGAITHGQEGSSLTDIDGMVAAGAVAISEDGKSVMDSKVYEHAMKVAKKAGIPILAHCEDKNLVGSGAMNEGAKSEELNVAGISNAVEDIIVARDILLAKKTGARLHLCHCSTKDSVMMVKQAKLDGVDVSAEVCPHHFSLTEDDILSDDANYKMNPPLRKKEDVDALIRGLSDGTMDSIATDHAPHSADEKKKGIAKAPFGIVGLETAFALTVTELVNKGHMSMKDVVDRMSLSPARILGIDKGCLDIGRKADITIADISDEYEICADEFVSKGHNTPFDKKKVYGKIVTTIVDGDIVYRSN